jgi:hypothetical protein
MASTLARRILSGRLTHKEWRPKATYGMSSHLRIRHAENQSQLEAIGFPDRRKCWGHHNVSQGFRSCGEYVRTVNV